ncbi:hypothetical protein AB2M62_05435 [Sphingomonas sp. MMS12-HWE2-04]|uniref:hypothetical protein n=1 Tax=Sphingomonas sp. MMS12-HWE2-04 TaxID=3234199 RepID=UPI003850AD01
MDDKEIGVFVIRLLTLVVPASLILALWVVLRLRRRSDQPLSHDMTGATVIPVRNLKRYSFFSKSANSISPRLELVADGLRFKIFKQDYWAFSDIVEVDAPWMPFGTRVALRHASAGRLFVDLADTARAGELLRAMPERLAYTQRAMEMRDDV